MSGPAGAGSNGVQAYFGLPDLPNIVSEWAGLIPLVVHLGSSHDDYELVGETCLRGKFTAPMFPKLGQLERITEFLSSGFSFFDQTSGKGMGAATVWDVSWGSVFQCANASAREMLTKDALRKRVPVVDTETLARAMSAKLRGDNTILKKAITTSTMSSSDAGIRRYQTLTVVKLSKAEDVHSRTQRITTLISSPVISLFAFVFLLGLVAVLCLASAFGTAAILLIGCVTKGVCLLVPTSRPKGYLQNTESYANGCYLAAAHENALSWELYVGDRGPVDWLLNKPLLAVDQSVPQMISGYFKVAHYLQLLVMTYVAAQKSWDGVCLLGLMMVTLSTNWMLSWDSPSKDWLEREGITCTATVARLSGRTPMLGAVQLLNDRDLNPGMTRRNTGWMDGILSTSVRRDAWTDALLRVARGTSLEDAVEDNPALTEKDMTWIRMNIRLSVEAAELILQAMNRGLKNNVV